MYKVGDKIKFKSEKQRYKIIACDARYLVCIKPLNVRQTYLYTIVDLKDNMRGPENLLFGGYDLREGGDADRMLVDLQSGKIELSPRRSISLDLETE